MALYWSNPATGNRFANKHLYIIAGSPTLQSLVDDGWRVFNARVQAFILNKNRRTKGTPSAEDLKARYGVGKQPVTKNTLLVLSNGGWLALQAAIIGRGYQSGWYTVKNGVIFDMTDSGYDIGLVAKLQLGVRPCTGGYEVWHLEDVEVGVPVQPSTVAAKSQTKVREVPGSNGVLGLQFSPTAGELALAKAGLKKVVMPTTGGVPTWALGDITGVDLSFLDD